MFGLLVWAASQIADRLNMKSINTLEFRCSLDKGQEYAG
jgi:hypothetical protein